MTNREKLIELLKEAEQSCVFDKFRGGESNPYFYMADYLISKGVIVLPFKLGEDIYDISEYVENREHPEIYSDRADYVCVYKKGDGYGIELPEGIDLTLDDFGKTIFTDEKEAERKAAEWMEHHGRDADSYTI